MEALLSEKIEALDTPALVADLDVMEKNIQRMANYCRELGLKLRPHIKTHKIPEIAHLQVEAGAAGITVAKLSEAEVMIEAGLKDVLVAFPLIGDVKTRKVAHLARRARITVAIDSVECARQISAAAAKAGSEIHLLLDMDVGFGRTGFQSVEVMKAAAKEIQALPNVKVEGLFCFPGHVLEKPEGQGPALSFLNSIFAEAKAALEDLGIRVRTISSGSTPTAYQSQLSPLVTEVRPGTYVFNDANYLAVGAHEESDCALTVHTTVVSTSIAGQVVVDGGSKTFSSESAYANDGGYGRVLGYPEAKFFRCSEEHGWIDVSRCSKPPVLGERLRIIPNHVCPAVNLHDVVYGARAGVIEVVWRVAARGKVH